MRTVNQSDAWYAMHMLVCVAMPKRSPAATSPRSRSRRSTARGTPLPLTLAQALAVKLRQQVQQQQLSQRDLARILGVNQSAISTLLNAKRRRRGLDYYQRLASFCGQTLSELCRELEGIVRQST